MAVDDYTWDRRAPGARGLQNTHRVKDWRRRAGADRYDSMQRLRRLPARLPSCDHRHRERILVKQ